MHKVKAITDDDQGELVSQLCFLRERGGDLNVVTMAQDGGKNLEEVLDSLRIITVAFSADSLHFFHLSSFASSLHQQQKYQISSK